MLYSRNGFILESYDTNLKDLTSNLAVIEAKNEKPLKEAKAQLLCYMGIQPPPIPHLSKQSRTVLTSSSHDLLD